MGQACVKEGSAKCTFGTGAFLLLNTGRKPAYSNHRLLTTVAWALKDDEYTYALEGSAFIAGAAVQWVRDGLKFINDSSEIETLAKTVKDSDGVVFVPALTGMGAPYWEPSSTGLFTGITRGTQRGHMARAVLEGIAFQNADILTAMQKDMGKSMTQMNVDGGASINDLLMQFQADILSVSLRRPKFTETTSLGAVFAAGLGAGLWTDLSDVEKTWKEDRRFEPKMSQEDRNRALTGWHLAVSRCNFQG
jgi:glycerol kinase